MAYLCSVILTIVPPKRGRTAIFSATESKNTLNQQ